jgi:hypothetical protein
MRQKYLKDLKSNPHCKCVANWNIWNVVFFLVPRGAASRCVLHVANHNLCRTQFDPDLWPQSHCTMPLSQHIEDQNQSRKEFCNESVKKGIR